jgi:Fe-S cluster assembly ATP-binding protein
MLLEIKNLTVATDRAIILKDVSLKLKEGEVQALLGPNASGKSTLAQVILGNPKYKIKQGKIFFLGKDITKLSSSSRAKRGIALAHQYPPAIPGVKLSRLLDKISEMRKNNWQDNGFKKEEFKDSFLNREVNVNFSGGEKKMSELLQILVLKPRLVVFDEIDSGLDLKKIKKAAEIIKRELIKKKITVLFITHSGDILKFLNPGMTNIMLKGKIICQQKDYKKVLRTIKRYGYEKCKKGKLFSG